MPAAPGNVMTLSFTKNKPDWMQGIEKPTYSRIIGSAPTVSQINDAYNTLNPAKYIFKIEATDQTGSTAPDLEVSALPNSSLTPPAWKKNVDNNNLPLPQATKGKAYDPIDLYNYVSRSLKAGAEVENDELFFRLNTPVNCPFVITDSHYLSSNGILPGDAPSTCDIQISVYSRAYGLHSPTDPVKGNPATAQLQTDDTQYSAIFTPTLSIHAGTNPEWSSNEIQIEPSNTGTIYNAFNIDLSPYVAKPTKPNGNYEVIFMNKNGFDLVLDEEAPKGSSSKWYLIPGQDIDLQSLVGQTMTISLGLRDRNTGGTSEAATIRIPVTSTNDIEFRWASSCSLSFDAQQPNPIVKGINLNQCVKTFFHGQEITDQLTFDNVTAALPSGIQVNNGTITLTPQAQDLTYGNNGYPLTFDIYSKAKANSKISSADAGLDLKILVPKLIVDGNLNQNAFQIKNSGAQPNEYYTSLVINGLKPTTQYDISTRNVTNWNYNDLAIICNDNKAVTNNPNDAVQCQYVPETNLVWNTGNWFFTAKGAIISVIFANNSSPYVFPTVSSVVVQRRQ